MKYLVTTALALLWMTVAHTAVSAEVPYDSAKFSAMRAAGEPVAVVFHADWCPTCRAQAPVLRQLAQAQELRTVTIFVANFDSETVLKRALAVSRQSTVVVFRKGQEVARSTGDTQLDALRALLLRAVG